MARCDLCGKHAEASSLKPLMDRFRAPGITDICSECDEWAKDQHARLIRRAGNDLESLIRSRAGQKRTRPWWKFWERKTTGNTSCGEGL
jgi:hypothetical protein